MVRFFDPPSGIGAVAHLPKKRKSSRIKPVTHIAARRSRPNVESFDSLHPLFSHVRTQSKALSIPAQVLVPPLREFRPDAPSHQPRLLAQFRRRRHRRTKSQRRNLAPRKLPEDALHRLRPGHHPLRSGEQLRTAAGKCGIARGKNPSRRFCVLSRRADHLHKSWLRNVARAVRKLRLAEISSGQPRRFPEAPPVGLRRYLLSPLPRRRHAGRGIDGGTRPGRAQRQGDLRGDQQLSRRPDGRRRRHRPARASHPANPASAGVPHALPCDRKRFARRYPALRAGRYRVLPSGSRSAHQ